MDLNDPFPFPPEAIRRRGPPPLEPLARTALPLRTTRRRDVLETEDESDNYSSDGSYDTLRDAMHRERARESARTTNVIPRPPWRSAPPASRTAPSTAQDVLVLEQETQTAWSSLGLMRSLKDRLYGENKVLRAELDALKKEVEQGRKREAQHERERDRLKGRYEDAWRERVLLAEQLAGPASIPLELLLNIAGFVAGANEYGTLLDFSLLSKVIHQEFKPVLYETMWFADVKHSRFLEEVQRRSDVAVFVKFVYVGRRADPSTVEKSFPNIRVAFHLIGAGNDSPYRESRKPYTPYNAQLTVFRTTRMDSLASLLRCGVKWGDFSKNHRIKGILSIDIRGQGALVDCNGEEKDSPFRNLVKKCEFQTSNLHAGTLADSIKQLIHFVPVRPKDHNEDRRNHENRRTVSQLYPAMKIRTASKEELDVWLANLTAVLTRQPGILVDFDTIGILTRDEFRHRVLRAAAICGSIWHHIKDSIKSLTSVVPPERASFFTMDYESGRDLDSSQGMGDGELELAAWFTFDREGEGFKVQIVEADFEAGTDRFVYDQPFDIPAA